MKKSELENLLTHHNQRIERDGEKITQKDREILKLQVRLDACLYAMFLMQSVIKRANKDEWVALAD